MGKKKKKKDKKLLKKYTAKYEGLAMDIEDTKTGVKYESVKRLVKKWYKCMGKIDPDMDYLAEFRGTLHDDIKMVFESKFSNHEKANMLDHILEPLGFIEKGLGTNVCTFFNADKYPGVVFKIACDPGGISDNLNDRFMAAFAPEAKPPVVVDMTDDALISVQEFVYPINDAATMRLYWNEAINICESLSRRFLVIDVTPVLYANWAIGRDMELRTCDVSDLFPLPSKTDVMRCNSIIGESKNGKRLIQCGGKVYYDENYQWCYCTKCGRKFLPIELRPKAHIWDESELCGTGYTKWQERWTDRRALHYRFYKNSAACVGLKAKYIDVAMCTPLPETYETVPMTAQEISKAEREFGCTIKPYTGPLPFRVEYSEGYDDLSDDFYRKHGELPRKVDDRTYLNLDKLLDLKPDLVTKPRTVYIGEKRIVLRPKKNEPISNKQAINVVTEEVKDLNEIKKPETETVTNTEPTVDTTAVSQKVYRDDLGFVIGSEERKEHYRNLEVDGPLTRFVDGKRVFTSKDAQIIWFRVNKSPGELADMAYARSGDDIVKMVETFERYYPDSDPRMYFNVPIPAALLGSIADDEDEDDDAYETEDGAVNKPLSEPEHVESISLNNADAARDAIAAIYGSKARTPKRRIYADDPPETPAQSKIESISMDTEDAVPETSPMPSKEFGTDIDPVTPIPIKRDISHPDKLSSKVESISMSADDNVTGAKSPGTNDALKGLTGADLAEFKKFIMDSLDELLAMWLKRRIAN